MLRKISGISALLAAAVVLPLTAASAAHPSGPAVKAAPASSNAYTSTGEIRPAGSSGWCLTAGSPIANNDALYLARCAKGDKFQQFFAWREPVSGGMNNPQNVNYQVANKGGDQFGVLTDELHSKQYNTVLSFRPDGKYWAISVTERHAWYLAAPPVMKGNNVYVSTWSASPTAWLLPAWKHLAP